MTYMRRSTEFRNLRLKHVDPNTELKTTRIWVTGLTYDLRDRGKLYEWLPGVTKQTRLS